MHAIASVRLSLPEKVAARNVLSFGCQVAPLFLTTRGRLGHDPTGRDQWRTFALRSQGYTTARKDGGSGKAWKFLFKREWRRGWTFNRCGKCTLRKVGYPLLHQGAWPPCASRG